MYAHWLIYNGFGVWVAELRYGNWVADVVIGGFLFVVGMAFQCSWRSYSVSFLFLLLVNVGKSLPREGLAEQDVRALWEIKRAIAANSRVMDDWGVPRSPCGWFGVVCDEVPASGGGGGRRTEIRVVSLQLNSQQLRGSVPAAIGGLSELKDLSLADNLLFGRIPKDLAACRKLECVDLRGNRLSGSIPPELSGLANLKVLQLSDNHLSGEISFLEHSNDPADVFSVPFVHLKYLDLANNNLTGKIPYQIGRISELESIYLNGNMLMGTIPTTLGSLHSLVVLHLHNNFLHGRLPAALAINCRKLQSLDVSSNFLVGRIPPSFAEAKTLRFLNVSNNDFEGPIPWGSWFQYGAHPSAFSGNTRLCGHPLRSCSATPALRSSSSSSSKAEQQQQSESFLSRIFDKVRPDSSPSVSLKTRFVFKEEKSFLSLRGPHAPGPALAPTPAPAPAPAPGQGHHNATATTHPEKKKQKRKHHSSRKWAWGLLIGTITGAISATVCSLLFRMLMFCARKKPKVQGAMVYSSLIKTAEDLAFLESAEGLATGELIGKGGSGEVYKAQLPDGRAIAIKKIPQPIPNPADVSEEDSKLLDKKRKQIRAELETLGHIRHRNLVALLAYVARPDCHLLVYEFMKNGSLQQTLQRVAEGTLDLTWPMRHKIALGIASGLQYLHFHSHPKIIHRDLKPGNILLDEDFEAHVADFGLAKAIPEAATHCSSSNVAGTVGYIAPEYHQTLKFTDKCDVYSFGVLLAVLLTGKQPYDDFFQTIPEASIPKWLRNIIGTEAVVDAIDSKLRGNGYDDEMALVLKVACFCTDDDPSKRPNSREVFTMLSQIHG